MTTPQNLEDQLREHYSVKASELRLPPIDLDDVLARGDVPVTAVAPAAAGRRNQSWLVAAALIGGGVIGAGAIVVTRDGRSSQSDVPQTAPVGPRPAAADWCPDGGVPDDVADLDLPNDVRVANILLPAATPERYCAADHQVATNPRFGHYTVWSSCAECDRPTAAVARVDYLGDEDFEGDRPSASVDVGGGRDGRFYLPSGDDPVSRLYVNSGAERPFMFVGWGLDEAGFVAFAENVLALEGAPEDAGEMTLVYDGPLGAYQPARVPVEATLDVFYFRDDGMGLGYSVLQSETSTNPFTPPLEAYAWALPNPVFATVDGRRTVTFPASDWYADGQQTAVIVQIDDGTQVMWTSMGTEPVPPDELADIELTPAAPDDPRWLEIAYESGNYDAQG